MIVVLVLFWVFLILAFAGNHPNWAIPYGGLSLCLAVLMLYFLQHGVHFP